jgi:hypothetical protein
MIQHIRAQAAAGRFELTRHALEEIEAEAISVAELLQALASGHVLEDYPTHRRGACCLVCGYAVSGRPLHVVCTTSLAVLRIITVYEPRLPWWVTPTQRRHP